ncbi:MAG: ABC transporter permease, partial [Candidatus Dormibacteraeota bacterium]|nr:ABC transporter permease [Candidatus Dormibacteraeota bacterium]
MRFADAAMFAVRNLRRRGVRTVLTGLAVTLGATLLVALLAISGTADSRVVSQLGKGGPVAAIHVDDANPAPNALASDDLQAGNHHDITVRTLHSLQHSAHVSSVVPVLSIGAIALPCPPIETLREAKTKKTTPACASFSDDFGTTVVGADLSQSRSLPVTVLAGRLPKASSLDEVAVSQSYFDHVHANVNRPQEVLGTYVEIATPQVYDSASPKVRGRWYQAQIVGVVAEQVESGDFLAPIRQTQIARQFELGGITDSRFQFARDPGSDYSALVVVADSLGNVHAVRQEIFNLGYANSAPEHLVASVQKYLHVVDIVLGGIGLVALAIACLGIASSLLAAVRERWREIGVMKAIGAADNDVLRWFLVEAAALGVAGGLLGTIVGLAVAWTVGLFVNSYLISQGLQGIDLGALPFQLAVVAPPL